MKRFISIVLVLSMILSMGITANAAADIKVQIIGNGNYSSKRAEYTFEGLEVGTTVNAATPAYAGNNGDYGLKMTFGADASVATALVAKDPVNEENMVLDINSKSPAASDQLVSGSTWQHSDVYHFVNVDLYFTGNDRYKISAITQGKLGSGTSTKEAFNVEFAVGNNSGAGFYANGAKVGEVVPPVERWFNFKIITNQSKPGYDIYMDNVKINDATIACSNTFDSLGTYTNFSFGVSKNNGSGGHMYMDNFVMSAAGNTHAMNYEGQYFSVPGFITTGEKLPLKGQVYTGVAVQWSCSNPDVVIDALTGEVTVPVTADGTTATFTATIGGSTQKQFNIAMSCSEKQLKKGIYGNYSSTSVTYNFEGNNVGDAATAIVNSGGGGSDGGYKLAWRMGSDPGSTALIALDPTNANNKVLDINSIAPTAAEQLTGGNTWQHTDEYHFIEMDLYLTGNDRYRFYVGNRNGAAVKFELGVGNNAGGAGYYVNDTKISNEIPVTEEWFNLKIIIGPNATYDLVVNNRKINIAPIGSNTRNTITSFSFGAVQTYGSGGHMYVDNLYMHRTNTGNITRYESDVLSLPAYISTGDYLKTKTEIFGIGLSWACDNANVTIGSNGVVTVPESEDGKTATFTATFSNGTTKQISAKLNGYALNQNVEEDFEYHWLKGKTASSLDNWTVDDEDTNTSTTHSISRITTSPDNSADGVFNVQVYRNSGKANYANYLPALNVVSSKYTVISSDFKLSSVMNDYVFYIQGGITNNGGSSSKNINLSQIVFRAGGFVDCIENTNVAGTAFNTSGSYAYPLNTWFRLDVVYNNSALTYDLYIDGNKINANPIKAYNYEAGYALNNFSKIQTGVARYNGAATNYYMDDLSIVTFDGRTAAGYDARLLTVPEATTSATTFATTGSAFGSTVTWASSNPNVLAIENGVAKITMPNEDTEVTLTATITNNGQSVTKTLKTKVLSDVSRLNNILKNVTGYTLTGQKYVKDNFTAKVAGLKDGDSVTVTSADTNVIAFNGLNATVTQAKEDKYVDVTVNIKSALGGSVSKTLKLYVISNSVILKYDGFDYSSNEGSSIAGKGGWIVENENLNTSATGSTHLLKYSPDDATDMMVDVEVFRGYNNGNQLVRTNDVKNVPGKAIMQMNMKFPDTAGNRYLLYVGGTYLKPDGSTYINSVSQFYIYRNNGTINCEGIKDGSGNYINLTPNGALPTNQWFNYKIEYDNINRCFDLYVDGVKQNTNPVPYYYNNAGDKLIAINYVQIGVSRYSGTPGHMYIDDFMIRASYEEVIKSEVADLSVPATFIYDYELPSKFADYEESSITWESSDTSVLSNAGQVVTKYGFGYRNVTLGATCSLAGEVATKSFDVKVINTPYFTIDNVVFTDGANDTYTPVPGGTIKNVSVTKYDPAAYNNAKVVVAVYDRDSLVAVSQPMAVTQTATINLGTQIPQNGENLYAKAFVWNMDTMAPLSYEFRTANELDSKIDIFSIGDSTMQSYGKLSDRQNANDMTGWMQVMSLGMDTDYVTVNNHGRSGKSTKSFTEQGWIDPVYENLGVGDYFIIQFGHNDQKPWVDQDALVNYAPLEEQHFIDGLTLEVPEQFANYKTYEQWLREYVAAARKKGAYPVFATSIRRRQFDESGNVKNSHAGYPEAMIEVAKELNVPVIDLHSKTATWINNHGVDDSLQFFCASYNGSDNTHLTYKGAVGVANIAIDAMKEIGLPIAQYATEIR